VAALQEIADARVEGLHGVDVLPSVELRVREVVVFSARHPRLHRRGAT